MLRSRSTAGFMLIELIVTVTVVGILLLTAAPALSSWTANAQVRTVSDALQDGLRLAQVEAARRNRQVSFVLTDVDPLGNGPWTASATGKNWVVLTVPVTALIDPVTGVAEVAQRVQGNTLAGVAALVAVQGPATLTFNSVGLVSGATGVSNYQVSRSKADHPLNVTVSVGGQIRSCDSSKAITDSAEGC